MLSISFMVAFFFLFSQCVLLYMEIIIVFLAPYYFKVSFSPQSSFLVWWLLSLLYFFQDIKNILNFFSVFFVRFSVLRRIFSHSLWFCWSPMSFLFLQCMMILGCEVIIIVLGDVFIFASQKLLESWVLPMSQLGHHPTYWTYLRPVPTLWWLQALSWAKGTARVPGLRLKLYPWVDKHRTVCRLWIKGLDSQFTA